MSIEARQDSSLIQLHLGCGEKYLPGFIHIDINQQPHIDYCCDIRDLAVFDNNYADLIYTSHTLEYFDRDEVDNVLTEWRRVLKDGGILRLAVPDFEAIVKIYQKYRDLDHRGILGPLYGKWPYRRESNSETSIYHKTVYDYGSLMRILKKSGFRQIRRYNWWETSHAAFDDYSQAYIPHMDKENGMLISLNVEAIK